MKLKKGFTLIELVVVMAIIAVLSMLIIAAIQAARKASIETQNRGNARTIETAFEAYASNHNGQYPERTADTSFKTFGTAGSVLRPSGVGERQYLTSDLGSSCDSTDGNIYDGGGYVEIGGTSSFILHIANADCNGDLTTITH